MPTVATPKVYGADAYHAANRISRTGLVGIVGAHVGLLALLVSLDAVPLPPPLATLMVQVIAPAQAPEATPPHSVPVERKPQMRPLPVRKLPTLAAQTEAPSAAVAPTAKDEPPPAPAVAAAPLPAAATQPRFDADYLSNPAPAYPPLSRRLGEEGRVVLRVYVEPGGRPGQIEVKSGSGSARLDQAAQEAVWRWKFIPARRGDEAVGAWVLVPIVFNLRG